ncbi:MULTISPECIES: hypothetical protein [Yersinia pseudotuberculosis complex]|uniref:Uncharacterized protein n=1 Tax=Yersinia pseudotuberculosis serotype O:1b (strain IP 31758) TaxID=349747 RepID=A0A0U1QTE7_YERP3|nr:MULTISPECIES: hypothetical protein [Yersinia pseudotuberculosis complex]ABS45656.1 hypothetical protein YpsIP31758_B0057 [Yersinia pseudotuberculosis IP 31758]MCE4113210.1 hypothetical protein [Yersinia pseudotuberculosis]RYC26226.1 hypothetical protein EU971_11125 [Yersinia pseudotuberculosis]WLF06020.1 hypothetical protein Q6G25_21405 [Yersinia pseudotuberculosis]
MQQLAFEHLWRVFSHYNKATANTDGKIFEDIYSQIDYLNHFEFIESEKNEKEEDSKERLKISDLDSSGLTRTNIALHEITGKMVAEVRKQFGSSPLTGHLWAYRHGEAEILCCDLYCKESDTHMPFTITATGIQRFRGTDEPYVYDMAEAVHLAGLLIRALDVTVEVGRGSNEVNPAVLVNQLSKNRTNGPINLWK